MDVSCVYIKLFNSQKSFTLRVSSRMKLTKNPVFFTISANLWGFCYLF